MKYYGLLLIGVLRACTPTFRFREGKLEIFNDEPVGSKPEPITRALPLLNNSSAIESEKI